MQVSVHDFRNLVAGALQARTQGMKDAVGTGDSWKIIEN